MLKTIMVLPDGTQLTSSADEETVILSSTVTESVNEAQELTLGSVCAARLEVKIGAPNGGFDLQAGQEVQIYKADENDSCHLIGLFALEKPVRRSANTLTLTGYDRVTRLDRDLSRWFAGLDGWPYSLYTLAAMVCDVCGLELANESIPNGDHPVQAFSASGITGRTLMKWIGQACGRFCRATPEGKIEFAWYAPVTPEITPGGEVFYFRNGLTYEDYRVYPIEKVQVHQTQDDVGVVWPDETGEKNTYVITGNLLLTTENTDALLPVVQSLYEQLCPVSYTPCRVTIPGKPHIRAGSIVTITDRNGKTITAYVMTSTLSGNRQTLECTGSYRRDSTTAVNQQSYGALDGKILNLQTDVEGISSENKDTAGKVSLLQQTVDGISTRVSDQQGQISQIQQSANAVSVRVGQIENGGVSKVVGMGYSFTDSGLLIEKDRDSVKTKIDNQGMEVSSNDTPVRTANKRGVVAVDVSVKNYLEIGHARFEDYTSGADSNRTACFFI